MSGGNRDSAETRVQTVNEVVAETTVETFFLVFLGTAGFLRLSAASQIPFGRIEVGRLAATVLAQPLTR